MMPLSLPVLKFGLHFLGFYCVLKLELNTLTLKFIGPEIILNGRLPILSFILQIMFRDVKLLVQDHIKNFFHSYFLVSIFIIIHHAVK